MISEEELQTFECYCTCSHCGVCGSPACINRDSEDVRDAYNALRDEVERLKAEITHLHQDNHKLEHQNADLRAEVERLKAAEARALRRIEVLNGEWGLEQNQTEALHAYAVRLYRVAKAIRHCANYLPLYEALVAAPESVKAAAERDDKDGAG